MILVPSDIESDENLSFEIFEVTETKGLTLDVLNQFVGSIQFGIRIGHFQGIDDVSFVLFKGLEDRFKSGIDELEVVFYESKELLRPFLLKMKEEELVEVIVKAEFL